MKPTGWKRTWPHSGEETGELCLRRGQTEPRSRGTSCCRAQGCECHRSPWAGSAYLWGSFVKRPDPQMGEVTLVLGPCSGSCFPPAFTLMKGGRRRMTPRSAGARVTYLAPAPPPRRVDRQAEAFRGRPAVLSPRLSSWIRVPKSEKRRASGPPWFLGLVPGTCVAGPPTDPPAPGLLLRGHLPAAVPALPPPPAPAPPASPPACPAWVPADVPACVPCRRRGSCSPRTPPLRDIPRLPPPAGSPDSSAWHLSPLSV